MSEVTLPELLKFAQDAIAFTEAQKQDPAFVEVKVITVQGSVKQIRTGHMYGAGIDNPILYLH